METPQNQQENAEQEDQNSEAIEKQTLNEQSIKEQLLQSKLPLNDLRLAVERIKNELGKIIIGQDQMIELLIIALLADGHVLIEGVPGIAKTLTAKLMARCVATKFTRIQFTPDLMPSDVLGTIVFNQKSSEFEFKKGPIFSNIVLIDEINRAPAKTQAALFEVMEERQVTMDGIEHKMEPPFLILATQNPIDQEGTYRLPEAQLDRFLFKIEVDYPSLEEEVKILENFQHSNSSQAIALVKKVISVDEILKFRQQIMEIKCEEKLRSYIAQIVQLTRNDPSLMLGASPRASLAILLGAKTKAAISGRDFIVPEDIQFVIPNVIRHRIIITPEKEMEGVSADDIVRQIIDRIEIPR